MGGGDARAELGHQRVAVGHNLVAELDDFDGETFQRGFVDGAAFQQCIAGAHGAGVVLQKGKVSGQGLGEEEIEEAPPAASGAFDELEILGGKGDSAEGAEVIGELADGLLVERKAAFVFAPIKFDGVRAGGDDASAHEPAGLAMAHHRGAAHAAKAAEGGEQMNGLE